MSKYPSNWAKIRRHILRRAGGMGDDPRVGARCEFCGVQNYAVRLRDGDILKRCSDYKAARRIADDYNLHSSAAAAVIVLTIAHLSDPDPMNCADDNLAALCQRCHNGYDVEMRIRNRQARAVQAQVENGQLWLPLALVEG